MSCVGKSTVLGLLGNQGSKRPVNIMRRVYSVLIPLFVGCNSRSVPPPGTPTTTGFNASMAAAGMSRYQYLAADGGPHMLLPAEASATWTGVSQDYGRA